MKQEGTGKYNKYIRYMFKTYLSSTNPEFNEAIKDAKRKWTQDLLKDNYSHTDLMETTTKTNNNIVANRGWELLENTNNPRKKYRLNSMEVISWHRWLRLRY